MFHVSRMALSLCPSFRGVCEVLYVGRSCVCLRVNKLLLCQRRTTRTRRRSSEGRRQASQLRRYRFLLSGVRADLHCSTTQVRSRHRLDRRFYAGRGVATFQLEGQSFLLLICFLFLGESRVRGITFLCVQL